VAKRDVNVVPVQSDSWFFDLSDQAPAGEMMLCRNSIKKHVQTVLSTYCKEGYKEQGQSCDYGSYFRDNDE
jgi:hypothetical protein